MPTRLNYTYKGFIITLTDSALRGELVYRSPYAEGHNGNTLSWGDEERITNEQAIEMICEDVESMKFQ